MNSHRVNSLGSMSAWLQARRQQGLGIAVPAPSVVEVEVTPSEEAGPSPSDLVVQYLPTAAAILSSSFSKSPAVLQSQIRNHKRVRNRFPKGSPVWTFYNNKIKVLKAKLADATQGEKREEELRQSRREWSTLGKVAVVSGIVVALGMTMALFRVGSAAGRYRSAGAPQRLMLTDSGSPR